MKRLLSRMFEDLENNLTWWVIIGWMVVWPLMFLIAGLVRK